MSTLHPTKKISRRQELRQDRVVTFYARALGYIEEHRTQVYGLVAAVVVVMLGVVGYSLYLNNLQQKAEEAMAGAVKAFEKGNFREALDGTSDYEGLLALAEDYGATKAGNLAHFYAANALFELGEYDEALEHFDAFDKDANFLGASALAGEAAVYENKGDFERAGDLFMEAASLFENPVTAPEYLVSAARAYIAAGKVDDARDAYEMLKEDYPESTAAANVDTYLAYLEAQESHQAAH